MRYDVLQYRMCGASGFNRDGIANTVRTKVVDIFFKEHFAKTKNLRFSQWWVQVENR
jgi:hypothetical protein